MVCGGRKVSPRLQAQQLPWDSPGEGTADGSPTLHTQPRAKAGMTSRQQAVGGYQEQPRPRLRGRPPYTCHLHQPSLQSRRGPDMKEHRHSGAHRAWNCQTTDAPGATLVTKKTFPDEKEEVGLDGHRAQRHPCPGGPRQLVTDLCGRGPRGL